MKVGKVKWERMGGKRASDGGVVESDGEILSTSGQAHLNDPRITVHTDTRYGKPGGKVPPLLSLHEITDQ